MMFEVKHIPVILSEDDYRAALQQLEEWIRAQRSELVPLIDALGTLIAHYEELHHPVPAHRPSAM